MADNPELDDTELDEWDVPPEPGTFNIGMEGHLWNIDRYYAIDTVLPEKLELIDGKLFGAERWRLGMLGAMLEVRPERGATGAEGRPGRMEATIC
jgi:hypothetical protein